MSCDTLPGISFKSGWTDILFKIYYIFFRWTFGIPDIIHFYTDEMARLFRKELYLNQSLLWHGIYSYVIPTGIDIKKFEKYKPHKQKNIHLIYAGELTYRKGLDRIFKMADSCYNIYFDIYGKGPYYKKIRARNIYFHGWSKNLPQDLKKAHAAILLSRGEGLCGFLMEAMACKLPIIASDIPGNRELIEHEKTGFLVNNETEALLAISYLSDKMGKAGYMKIKSYDWKYILPKYMEMYKCEFH